jgi:hypothetical protein
MNASDYSRPILHTKCATISREHLSPIPIFDSAAVENHGAETHPPQALAGSDRARGLNRQARSGSDSKPKVNRLLPSWACYSGNCWLALATIYISSKGLVDDS